MKCSNIIISCIKSRQFYLKILWFEFICRSKHLYNNELSMKDLQVATFSDLIRFKIEILAANVFLCDVDG